MKKSFLLFSSTLVAIAVFTSSCDWTSGGGGSDFNTSQGAGVNVNWSGVYFGQIDGRVVATTSGGAINRLVITQVGNRLEATDNQGSRYVGSVGVPELLRTPGGVLPAGSVFVESQVSFSGKDEVSGKDIDFVGIIHIVTVEDVQGSSTEETFTITNPDTTSPGSSNVTTTVEIQLDQFGDPVQTNTVTTSDVTSGSFDPSSGTDTTTTTTTYSITEANSQFRLQGTWIEQGGVSSAVDALSPGGIATVTTTTTTTN